MQSLAISRLSLTKVCVAQETQTSDTVLMVRPAAFGFHSEAARSNAFASASQDADVQLRAAREFEGLVNRLSSAGIEVLVLDDTPDPPKPDAVFPNNWVSFHADGTVALYPMATAARRPERNCATLVDLLEGSGFRVSRTLDLSDNEERGHFLEGTGSLILDRPRRHAFASRSPRTNPDVVAQFDADLGYSTHVFDAFDRSGQPIYHTNVLLSLGTGFAVLCNEVVADTDRDALIEKIGEGGRELIEVGYDQMCGFACNILELLSKSGDPVIAMSSTALNRFTPDQRKRLERHAALVDAPIPTIERVGGGSVRCMIADVHLPRR